MSKKVYGPTMNLVNLTPHAINFVWENPQCEYETLLTVEPSGIIARVSAKTVMVDAIRLPSFSMPITATEFGEIEGLPAPEEGTVYIVSSLVAQKCKDRNDVFIPNESVRDSQGRIIGCKSLGRI